MDVRVHLSPRNAHLGTFDEVAETVRCGLKALAATGFKLPDRTILIGAHELPPNTKLDEDAIIYNFEQRESPLLNASVLDLFRRHEVWDYSPSNVMWLAGHGIRAQHVPIGYVPELRRIEKHPHPDIDVLFYGLVNARRLKILDHLRAKGLRVAKVHNSYGIERDRLIGASKVVLNLHFYETRIFEMVRCSYLLANEICVVSEQSEDVPPSAAGVQVAAYDEIVDACLTLARDDKEYARKIIATDAFDIFRQYEEASILREALSGPRP